MDGLNEMIQSLINKTEDKEQLEILGSLNTKLQDVLKEQEKTQHKIELLEEDNAFYKNAYKESILFGGFKQEATPKPEVVENIPQHKSVEDALQEFLAK